MEIGDFLRQYSICSALNNKSSLCRSQNQKLYLLFVCMLLPLTTFWQITAHQLYHHQNQDGTNYCFSALSLLNYHALSMHTGIWFTIIDVMFTSGAIIAQCTLTSEIANFILWKDRLHTMGQALCACRCYIVIVNLHGKLHRSCMGVKHIHLSQIDTDHQSIQMGRYTENH